MRALAGALLAFAFHVAPALATQRALFDEGSRLYQEENFAGAVTAYTRVLEEGFEGGTLYYNLGNAYFKLGRLGPAILSYERARRFMPRDDDLRANLELARSLTTDDITPRPAFLPFAVVRWWVDLLPRSALIGTVGLAYVLAMVALVAAVLRPGTPTASWAVRTGRAGGAIALVFSINLAVRELGVGEPPEGIVLAESAPVQSAPSDDTDLHLFTIHAGTKVRLDQQSDEWLEVVLEDGRVGWIREEGVERI